MSSKKEDRIDAESAEIEFERFCCTQRVDIDTEDLDEEDLKSFEGQKKKIIRAIMKGDIELNDAGEAAFKYEGGDDIIFKKPKASTLLAMDRAKKGQDMKAMFDLMGEICEVAPAMFRKMDMADAKICMAITSLFLAS